MSNQVWKSVVGFEGLYQISDLGNVMSVRRVDNTGHRRGGHILSQRVEKSGYHSVGLYKDGKMKRIGVHRLVLLAFVGPRPEGQVGRHLNDIKSDNALSNLAWGTQVENKEDSRRNGTLATRERNGGGGKLKEAQVDEIKLLLTKAVPGSEIARMFGVTKETVYDIKHGRTWK